MNITWVYPPFLILIPVLLGLFLLRRSRHVRSSVSRPKVKHLLASQSGVTSSTEPAKLSRRSGGWFGLIALCFACVALARPQYGEIEQQTYERSREVVIALDLSRSMLATDVPPSRLDRSKLLVDSLINELKGERLGLVVFAGTSFVQCPLSNDYEILRQMLKEVNPTFLPQQGTDFGKLLQTAYKAFDFSSTSDRFLIVLSDGEDLAGDWKTELKSYQDARIHIIALGVGTTAGSVLPETGGGVIKDEKGAVVLSRLDSSVLQELATQTGGRYVEAYRWVDLSKVISETVDRGERGEFAKKEAILKVERFQIPLILAITFAFLSLWRDFPVFPKQTIKKPSTLEESLSRHSRKKGSSKIPSATALLLLSLLLPLSAQEMSMPSAAAPGQPKPAEKLSGTVQTLSSKDNLNAPDYAQLAQETIGYGKAQQQAKADIEMGAIDDALLGVDDGEALDGKAADWPTLRKELEELKKKSSDQQQQKKDQQKQDQKDKDNKDQKQDQKQNSGGSGKQDNKDQQKDSQGGQNSPQDQKDKQDQKDQQSKDPQSKGQDSKDQKDQQNGQSGQDQKDKGAQGKDPKDQKDQNSNQGQDPKDQDGKNQPQPAPGKPEEKKDSEPQTKKVGGSSGQAQTGEESKDAETADIARKLDQIKQKDSPGQIYQLFSPQEPSKEIKGKTW